MQIFILSTTRIRLLYSPIIFRLVYFFESYHFALYIRIYIYASRIKMRTNFIVRFLLYENCTNKYKRALTHR